MPNPNQVTGRAKVKISGAIVHGGNVKLELGGAMREGVSGDYRAGGFRRTEDKPSKLEFDALSTKAFSPAAVAAYEDETVSVEFDTGQTFIIRHAWAEGAPTVDTSSGKASIVIYGPPAEEVR